MADETFQPEPGEEHYQKFQITSQHEKPDIRMELGAHEPGSGGPDSPKPELQELKNIPETVPPEMRAKLQALYTVQGTEIIAELKEAQEAGDVEWICETTEDAHAFMFEGLVFGKEAAGYDLENEEVLEYLQWRFETKEGLMSRPESTQVRQAIDEIAQSRAIQVTKYRAWKDVETRGGQNRWRRDKLARYERYWTKELAKKKKTNGEEINQSELKAQASEKARESLTNYEADLLPWVEGQSRLQALKFHTESRAVFDLAMRYRHNASNVDARAFQQLQNGLPEPDKMNWRSYYRYGEKNEGKGESLKGVGAAVHKVEKLIEDIGRGRRVIDVTNEDGDVVDVIDREVFVNGFRTAGIFKSFIKAALEESQVDGIERMDVVVRAWDMALWKENVTRNAWSVDLETGQYNFGDPPFADDLVLKVVHTGKKQLQELGLSAFSKEVRDASGKLVDAEIIDPDAKVVYRVTQNPDTGKMEIDWQHPALSQADDSIGYDNYLENYLANLKPAKGQEYYFNFSHAGHPFGVARGALAKTYMENTKVEIGIGNNRKKKVNLYEVAFGDGVRSGGLSQADEDFPWYQTEVRGPEDAADEPARGSKGGHNLSLMRAEGTKKNVVFAIPDPRKLTHDFFNGEESPMRTARKIKIAKPGPLNANGRPDNPFVYTFCGWCVMRGRDEVLRLDSEYLRGMRGYRPKDITQMVTGTPAGESKNAPSLHDIAANALQARCISLEEYNWIYAEVLRKPDPNLYKY